MLVFIPFGVAHIYIAYMGEYSPPPLWVSEIIHGGLAHSPKVLNLSSPYINWEKLQLIQDKLIT